MNWKICALVAFLYQYGLVQFLIKKIGAVEGSRTRKLVWQYFFAALLGFFGATVTGSLEFNVAVGMVALIGAANAFGCYCHWRAYDISMARTAVLSNLDDLFTMALGYAVLGELDVLTPILIIGIIVSVVSVTIFARIKYAHGSDNRSVRHLIGWVLGYSIIWGVAMFSMRFFFLHGISIFTYVAAWYVGAWLGALVTRYVIMGQSEAGTPLTGTQYAKVLILSLAIWTSLMFSYLMRQLVPITVVQPIQLVAEMSVPVLIALVLFGEMRTLEQRERIIIIAALAGAVLVAIGYHS